MSWPKVAISEFCVTGSGTTPSRKNAAYYGGDVPWVKSGELVGNVISQTEETVTEKAVAETSLKLAPAGALLLAMYGANVGRIAELGIAATTNQAICHIVPDPEVADRRYVFRTLETLADYFVHRGAGGAQSNISQALIKQTKIPLPPLEEQKRIAAILDKADELRRLRRRAIDRLDTLAQSIFYDMFGNSFQDTEITKFIRKIETGKNLVGNDDEDVSAYRVLKISAVNRNGFRPVETKALPSGYEPPAAHFVRNGDLLFSRANTSELVGLACIVDQAPERTALPDKLWRLVPESDARTEFLEQAILSPSSRRQIEQLCSGTSGSMKNISKAKFETLRVPAATPELQKSFANRCKSVREQKRVGSLALEETESLFASLQQRAFRGEL